MMEKYLENRSLNTYRWNCLDIFPLKKLDKQNRFFESKILHDFPQAVYPMRTYRILQFFARIESSKLQLSGNLNFIQIGYDLDGYMRAYRESSKFLFWIFEIGCDMAELWRKLTIFTFSAIKKCLTKIFFKKHISRTKKITFVSKNILISHQERFWHC